MHETHKGRLFAASCVAIVTTSMVFSIRGDIIDALALDFRLTKEQVGLILSPAFWGFTLSILIGGSLVDFLGMRRLLLLSAAGYVGAVLAIIFSPRPTGPVNSLFDSPATITLLGAMLTLGLAQGLVEGVVNPLIATMYPQEKISKLNILHAWWPAGLIIGGLLSYGITKMMGLDLPGITAATATFGWQIKLSLILVPAVAFFLLSFREQFPQTERVAAGISNSAMVKECFQPMFLLWWICMWMTAATELGPDQWVPSLITSLAGMQGIVILVWTAGIMFGLRFFAGPLSHAMSPLGLLAASAVLSAAGLYMLGGVSSPPSAIVAATVFGVGKTFFWPTMIAFSSERFPKTGPLGMAVIGGTGMLSAAFILPIMGGWYDSYGAAATFRYVGILPVILTVVFGGLFLYFKMRGGYSAVQLETAKGD
jgi:MFS family permease